MCDQSFLSSDNISYTVLQSASQNLIPPLNEDVANLLDEWNLTVLSGIFQKYRTDLTCLEYMSDADIDAIIPIDYFPEKCMFKKKLKEWRVQMGHTGSSTVQEKEDVNTSLIEKWLTSQTKSPSTRSELINDSDLELLLESSHKGRSLKEYYKEHNSLSEIQRSLLIDLIVEDLISRKANLRPNNWIQISQQIKTIFPSENTNTYYTPRDRGIEPRGKLYSKYNNNKKKLKRIFQPGISRSSTTLSETQSIPEDFNHSEETESCVKWLKFCGTEPWSKVEDYWRKTCHVRKTSNYVLKEWKQYTFSLGYILVDIDFEYLFEGKCFKLLENWNIFVTEIFPKLRDRIKDRQTLILVNENNLEPYDENSRSFVVALALHAVLPPSTRIVTRKSEVGGEKQYWKPSIKDSQESFIFFTSKDSDVHIILEQKRTKYHKFGLTLQPFIIVIGRSFKNVEKILVVFDDIMYTFQNLPKAIDICFKIFQLFKLEYPKESRAIWLFLQKYFYNIDTIYDVNIPALSSVLSDINHDKLF